MQRSMMDSRFRSLDDEVTKIESGGLFSKEKCM